MRFEITWREKKQSAWMFFRGLGEVKTATVAIDNLWNDPSSTFHDQKIRVLVVQLAELMLGKLVLRTNSSFQSVGAITWILDRILLAKETPLSKLGEAVSNQADLQSALLTSDSQLWINLAKNIYSLDRYVHGGENISRFSIRRGRDTLYDLIMSNLPQIYRDRFNSQFDYGTTLPIKTPIVPTQSEQQPFMYVTFDYGELLKELNSAIHFNERNIIDFSLSDYKEQLSAQLLQQLVSRAIAMNISFSDLKHILQPMSGEMIKTIKHMYSKIVRERNANRMVIDLFESLCIEIMEIQIVKRLGDDAGMNSAQLCVIFGIDYGTGETKLLFFQAVEESEEWSEIIMALDANYMAADTIICKVPRVNRRQFRRFLLETSLSWNRLVHWDGTLKYSDVSTSTKPKLLNSEVHFVPAITDTDFAEIFPVQQYVGSRNNYTHQEIRELSNKWYQLTQS